MALDKKMITMLALSCLLGFAAGQVSVSVSSAPFDFSAVPMIPASSSRAVQCGVVLNSTRFPGLPNTPTFPLTVGVSAGQRVRVIFANGNLNGATTTSNGEPGVIVFQNGSAIVQSVGGASPMVQNTSSPVLASNAPPSAQVNQASPTQLSSGSGSPAPTAKPATGSSPANPTPGGGSSGSPATTAAPGATPAAPSGGSPGATPAPNSGGSPGATPAPTSGGSPGATPVATDAPGVTPDPACNNDQNGHANEICPASQCSDPCCSQKNECQNHRGEACIAAGQCGQPQCLNADGSDPCTPSNGKKLRKLLQNTVPNGPNGGVVGYVALISSTGSALVVPNTRFGVPYVEFTAPTTSGQTASFSGALEFATVTGGNPTYPFTPAANSPDCQVNINFMVM